MLFFNAGYIFAQDIHFTQFYFSPLTLSPANTGNFDGSLRFSNNHRRQWGSIGGVPFLTTSVGVDVPFRIAKSKFAAGALVFNDKTGLANLVTNKAFFSLAYIKKIHNSYFHISAQAGYTTREFDVMKLTFPDQYDDATGDFNTEMPNNESNINNKLEYVDFNGGIAWSHKGKKFFPQLGVSMFHINEPSESFIKDGKNNLSKRIVGHFMSKYLLSDKHYITPSALYMFQLQASELVFGTNYGINVAENKFKAKSVFAGLYFRNGIDRNFDAGSVVAGIEFNQLNLGASYDFNISKLHNATKYLGGFEFSLIYIIKETRLNKITIPCDRY